ncbi:hypothetical protein KIPB_010731, partial [Kipferlia bialata]|eukprot:g10731.t1
MTICILIGLERERERRIQWQQQVSNVTAIVSNVTAIVFEKVFPNKSFKTGMSRRQAKACRNGASLFVETSQVTQDESNPSWPPLLGISYNLSGFGFGTKNMAKQGFLFSARTVAKTVRSGSKAIVEFDQ